jgi:hypothetical protein
MTKTTLAIQQIIADESVQPRAEIKPEVAREYSEVLANGASLPPLVVFHDGKHYWLSEGFHRRKAYELANITEVPVIVHEGGKRDAMLHAVGSNATHGLRRTNADKRRAVEMVLKDEEWNVNSDRWIAEKCAVSHEFVRQLRGEQVSTVDTSAQARTGKDGKQYPVNIGQNHAPSDAIKQIQRQIKSGEIDGYGRPIEPEEHEEPEGETVVMHPDLPEEEETRKPERLTRAEENALSDEDWLDTLPLRAKLRAEKIPERLFEEAALLWRVLQRPNNELRRAMNGILNVRSGDPYTMRVRTYVDTPHPSQWQFSRGETGGFILW